ncbi:hypothetical protein BZG35_08480 [Brevundimonas sp. LM2]|uniref:ArdC family protein n=1 Tax=Brevundimonas sp. LM2 TaxID=1938605 RepID=UPI000983DDBB|nr:zincin-like metallopeptidase domain-containing protein [Brevundimonas sp. LM2]AQR61683.1 hypothetical protein BZG35_08480 [Brevundimonas sp. LM2]
MKKPVSSRPDLYRRVTDQILDQLAQGVRPWTQPWATGSRFGPVSRPLRHSLEPYSGINVVLLWSQAAARGFTAPVWMTFRQALALKACVRKGETGTTVVYADRIVRPDTDDQGRDFDRSIPFLKAYTVFNLDQIDGLPETYRDQGVTTEPLGEARRLARADVFCAATRADIVHGGAMAFYDLAADRITLPPFATFHDAHGYYATLLHELTHWTRHAGRLDRDLGRRRFGDAGYAREELVAELGAAFLCADLGVALTPREDHAAYIAGWMKALGEDPRLIFTAAAHAQRACDYLQGLQPLAPTD